MNSNENFKNKAQEKPDIFQKPVLTMNEAEIYTGLKKSYLYKLTSTNEIPHYKPRGKKIYFKREELIAWCLSNKVISANEEKTEVTNHFNQNNKRR